MEATRSGAFEKDIFKEDRERLSMKDFKVAGFPLPLYVLILALTAACMFTGCVPKSLVPAFLVLMVFGEGLNAIGNNVPVVKTYLGGSVICILGSAILTAGGLIPEQTIETLDYFVNDSGFLIFYIAALICGSLFNIDRNLLLRATVKLLPVAVISLSMGILLSGIMGIILGEGFWGGILYIGVPMTSGGIAIALVLKADKAKLVWNQSIGKKISAAEAAGADFGARLEIGGAAVADQSSVSVLYSGFTSKWKVYSSTTTPPTEPGRYTMTVVVLGGNYLASPINRSFQITK